LSAGIVILSLLSEIDPNRFQKTRRYESCLILSKDYNIRITPNHLDDTEFLDRIFDGILTDAIAEQTSEKMNYVYRVGDLLGYDRAQLFWKIAYILSLQFRYAEVLCTCRALSDKFANERTGKMISELICLLLNQDPSKYLDQSNLSDLTSAMIEMSRLAVKNSLTEDLEYHLNLFKRVEFFHQIVSKTDKGAYQTAFQTSIESNRNPNLLFKSQYKEIGLVISSAKALPILLTFLNALKKSECDTMGKGKGKDNSDDFIESGVEIIQLCYRTRNYECCSRGIQLLLEHCTLKKIKVPAVLAEINIDAKKSLLQNVNSS
jgi:hypothetical protein